VHCKVSMKRPRHPRICTQKTYMTGLSRNNSRAACTCRPHKQQRYGPPQQTGQVLGPARAAAPHPVRASGRALQLGAAYVRAHDLRAARLITWGGASRDLSELSSASGAGGARWRGQGPGALRVHRARCTHAARQGHAAGRANRAAVASGSAHTSFWRRPGAPDLHAARK